MDKTVLRRALAIFQTVDAFVHEARIAEPAAALLYRPKLHPDISESLVYWMLADGHVLLPAGFAVDDVIYHPVGGGDLAVVHGVQQRRIEVKGSVSTFTAFNEGDLDVDAVVWVDLMSKRTRSISG